MALTSRAIKTTVSSGLGPLKDMEITQKSQVIAWGNYKGKLRVLLEKNGIKKVDGIEVYKPINLMSDFSDKDSDLYKMLDLLGIDEQGISDLENAKGDLKELAINFNGDNIVSPDMLEFSLDAVNNELRSADEVIISSSKKSEDYHATLDTIDDYYSGTNSIVEKFSISILQNGNDITSKFSEQTLCAIVAGRLAKGDDAIKRIKVEEKNKIFYETLEPVFHKTPFLADYKNMYDLDSKNKPYIMNGGGVIKKLKFHLWSPVIHDSRYDIDPNVPSGIVGQSTRQEAMVFSTNLASEYFYYSRTEDMRYLRVDGFNKLKIIDMLWFSRFFNMKIKQDCGFWCGIFKVIMGIIDTISSALASIISFGNESLKKIFESVLSSVITFYLMSALTPGAGFGMIAQIGAMDVLSIGISAMQKYQASSQNDFYENLERERNKMLNEKVEDPIEMVKVDGVGDFTDWEKMYYRMYTGDYDEFEKKEISEKEYTKEFGKG